MSLSVWLLDGFKTGASTFKNMQRSKMADFLGLCIVLCVSKVYSTVLEYKVWLWNQIRIAGYFPALMLPEAKSGKLEQDRGK